MESKELRIGNWVQSRIELGQKWDVVVQGKDLVGNYKLFEPIPITEEWLLNFGFEFTFELRKKCYSNLDYSVIFWFFKNGRVDAKISGVEFSENHRNKNKLIYVHQLQNLYFALTGEELVYGS